MRVTLAGFEDRADVRLGDAVFNAYDRNNVAWVLTDMDGWWELPEVNLPDDPRPFEMDGSYYTPGRYLPRLITLTGMLVPPAGYAGGPSGGIPSTQLTSYAREALGASINFVRTTGTLLVNEEVPKQAEVQLANRPSFKNSKVNGAIEFMIPLRANDPRKYSQSVTTASGVTLARSNAGRTYDRVYPLIYGDGTTPPAGPSNGIAQANNIGTYNTGAIIRLYGPVSTPTIEHLESGHKLMFSGSISAGDFLEIDLLRRSIMLNGTTNRRATLQPRSEWFMIDPGVNRIRLNGEPFGGSGETPYMDVTYRSAWLY